MGHAKPDTLAYPPRTMRVEQAARYVGVSPAAFKRGVAEGTLPKPIKWGGVTMWDRFDLDSTIEDLKVESKDAFAKIMGDLDEEIRTKGRRG